MIDAYPPFAFGSGEARMTLLVPATKRSTDQTPLAAAGSAGVCAVQLAPPSAVRSQSGCPLASVVRLVENR